VKHTANKQRADRKSCALLLPTATCFVVSRDTGKVLLELDLALQQLSKLRRLHLDFRSSLQLEHVEAITAACASRLQHLSLNMWAPGIGSKALVSIGQLSVLTSLQLMNMRAAVLSGPPGIIALREMPSLELLCVQVGATLGLVALWQCQSCSTLGSSHCAWLFVVKWLAASGFLSR
jgi:hypothetical protein